jgi:hypothetical protein
MLILSNMVGVGNMSKKLGIIALAFLTGCAGQYYKIPTPPVDLSKYEVVGTGSQTATGLMLLGFIPIQQNNKIERATKHLIAAHRGDLVTDITVRERWFWAWILNGYKAEVHGTVLRQKANTVNKR